ncbi:hypothetical protein UA32_12075 [Photobacterium angustum]|uniref:Uncharacterized protein n=1 Tax=Photobacterium angustum TaxID=661 RepID=A0ABX5GZ62_PHOAN|nr:hypothetical protein UA32_12075 [Photobacterium angustum]PSX03974.1 hypothetical protein C0W27_21000 [Photobacterium angustum]
MLYFFAHKTEFLSMALIIMLIVIYILCSVSRKLNSIIKDIVTLESDVINSENLLFDQHSNCKILFKGNVVNDELFAWSYSNPPPKKQKIMKMITSDQYYKLWS